MFSTGVIPRYSHIIAVFVFYVKRYVNYVNFMPNKVDKCFSTTVNKR